ncbi:MAG: hypothetical protein FWC13_05245 [Oscillospiraceae bacterium]|nr:hypothetical protein [Oscillospiraceae bacterium]
MSEVEKYPLSENAEMFTNLSTDAQTKLVCAFNREQMQSSESPELLRDVLMEVLKERFGI